MSITNVWRKSFHGVPVVREVFVETGTKSGDTLWEAKDLFPVCQSIEIDPEIHRRAVERFVGITRVEVHLGDSREVLPQIIDPKLATTFYLDAHCEGYPSFLSESDTECPLLAELIAITDMPWRVKPLVIVDDIHMFKADYWEDPQSNSGLFNRDDWPTMEEIAEIMHDFRFHEDTENRVGIWV